MADPMDEAIERLLKQGDDKVLTAVSDMLRGTRCSSSVARPSSCSPGAMCWRTSRTRSSGREGVVVVNQFAQLELAGDDHQDVEDDLELLDHAEVLAAFDLSSGRSWPS